MSSRLCGTCSKVRLFSAARFSPAPFELSCDASLLQLVYPKEKTAISTIWVHTHSCLKVNHVDRDRSTR
jgi:hypothetical protein